jgi:putative membrane protein insertion efficiency factor
MSSRQKGEIATLVTNTLRGVFTIPIVCAIRLWQFLLSPLFGSRCRFYPSCSSYVETAITRHGILRGGILSIWRIVRCQPLCAGGIDEVPAKKD